MRSILLLLALSACTAPAPPSDPLLGRWQMTTLVQDDTTDVTAEQNPAGNRFIVLDADGTFETGGDPYGPNTGRWTYDPATHELYLDSDAGEGDDSYWTVTLDGDTMRWQGARSDFTRRFRVNHVRAAP